jgi:hypothetical protein
MRKDLDLIKSMLLEIIESNNKWQFLLLIS